MPRHLQPAALYTVTSRAVAALLYTSCRQLDQLQRAEQLEEPQLSPRTPTQEEVAAQLSPRHQQLLAWLAHLPDPVVQDVVRELLAGLERHLLEDLDRKLVLAIINIERMRVNDFYFGLHSLLGLVQGFQVTSLQFSRRLWHCLDQYGEVCSGRYVARALAAALPGLARLTSLNIAHVATDELLCAVSRHLASLVTIDLACSAVTDKGVAYLAGSNYITWPELTDDYCAQVSA